MLGEVREKQFYGVTADNKQQTLIRVLQKEFLDRGIMLEAVSMDMDGRIKGAVRSVDEEVSIVADKFHVILHVNRVIDLCRIAVEKSNKTRFEIKRTLLMKIETLVSIKQRIKDYPGRYPKLEYRVKKFESVLKAHPEIQSLWDLKNKVHGFYRCKSHETAMQSWGKLLQFLTDHAAMHPEFVDLKKTFLNWETEILNYFVYGITNAYIEGLNNRIETLKRKKFGFRNKQIFLKSLCYMLFPISHVFLETMFTHF